MFRLFFFSILVSFSLANNILFDYCVGDLSKPGPTGYGCKDPTQVTVDDFVYSGLAVRANSNTRVFKFGANAAWTPQFPAMNGMGLSLTRADIDVGGVVPIHTHRVAELLLVVEGTVTAGFIDSNNKAFYKTLNKGELMIFPPELLHFQANVGSIPAVVYAAFASENPGVQSVNTMFQSNLPSELIERVTLLDHAQVKKLKKVFGGTN